jgi:hypothetical protein
MLFAVLLNSGRLGRRADPPAASLRRGLLPAELCARAPWGYAAGGYSGRIRHAIRRLANPEGGWTLYQS